MLAWRGGKKGSVWTDAMADPVGRGAHDCRSISLHSIHDDEATDAAAGVILDHEINALRPTNCLRSFCPSIGTSLRLTAGTNILYPRVYYRILDALGKD